MELTANDIRNYEFPSQMRGYEKNEVDKVLEEIAVLLENNNQENLKLSKEVEALSIQLTSLKQFEDTIKSAAIDARRNADLTMAGAKTEGAQLIAKARAEGDTILTSRAKEVANIESQIAKLTHARESYLIKVKDMISSHLSIIDEIMEVEPPKQKIQAQLGTGKIERKKIEKQPDDIDVLESSEVKHKKRETMATEPSKSPSLKIEDAQSAGKVIEVPTPAPKPIPAPAPKPTDAELAKNLEKVQEAESPSAETDSDDDTMPPHKPETQPADDLSSNLDDLVDAFEKTMDEASGEK